MADVFLAMRGQLNDRAKADLRKAGVVVVEVDDLDSVRFVKASETLSGDDMLFAAMDALKRDYGYGDHSGKQRERFALTIADLVAAARGDEW